MTVANRRVVTRLVVLVAGLALSLLPLLPRSIDADDQFSVHRALDDVSQIAQAPRPSGSAESTRVRDWIVGELQAQGLAPQLQRIEVDDYYGNDTRVPVVNILVRIAGAESTGAVMLMAHYDTVPTTLGANDNAGAIAILLEAARHFHAEPMRNDLILLFTDGEEPAPRFGSSAFVNEHPWFDDVRFVVNLEAIGSAGPSLLIETSGPSRWLIQHYAAAVPRPAAYSFLTTTSKLIGGSNTDFAPFRDAGVAGADFAYLRGSSIYHTPRDNIESVDRRSLEQHGANSISFVERIGNDNLGVAVPEGDSIYFTVGTGWVIRQGIDWPRALVVLGGAALVFVGRNTWRELSRGVVVVLLSAATAAIVATAIWLPVAMWRSTMGVTESYLYLVGFIVLAVSSAGLVASHRRIAPSTGATALAWWILALSSAGPWPGISYLFAWPAAIAAGVAVWRTLWPTATKPLWMLAGFTLVSTSTLVLLVPAIDVFYQIAQPRPGNPDSEVLPTIILPAVLISLVVQLLLGTAERSATIISPTTNEP